MKGARFPFAGYDVGTSGAMRTAMTRPPGLTPDAMRRAVEGTPAPVRRTGAVSSHLKRILCGRAWSGSRRADQWAESTAVKEKGEGVLTKESARRKDTGSASTAGDSLPRRSKKQAASFGPDGVVFNGPALTDPLTMNPEGNRGRSPRGFSATIWSSAR